MTLVGGDNNTFTISTPNPNEARDPDITFKISNDCAQIYEVKNWVSNGYNSINAIVYGRKPGKCVITAYAGDGHVIDSCTIEVTSTDTDYLEYEVWNQNVKNQVWTSGMTDVEKIAAVGNYILEHYPHYREYSGRYGFSKGIGGDCIASTDALLDIARDLGYKGESYWPLCFREDSFHHVAKININGVDYLFDAGASGAAGDRGVCMAVKASEMVGW